MKNSIKVAPISSTEFP